MRRLYNEQQNSSTVTSIVSSKPVSPKFLYTPGIRKHSPATIAIKKNTGEKENTINESKPVRQ